MSNNRPAQSLLQANSNPHLNPQVIMDIARIQRDHQIKKTLADA